MKHYFLFAAALLALASCSSDDILGGGQNSENASSTIQFGGETGKMTRADAKEGTAAELLDNNFVVVGYKGSATAAANTGLVFDHYNVNYKDGTANTTESNTKNWEYVNQGQEVRGASKKLAGDAVTAQTIKYWDNSVSSYDFLAFSMGKGASQGEDATKTYATPTAVNSETLRTAAYTLTGDKNTLGECYISDITTVEKGSYNKNAVVMNFRHATSKVRIALYETVPGYVISEVKFHDAAWNNGNNNAYDTENGKAEGTLFGTFNKKGTMTVFFPTTGTDNKSDADYNKAHVSFKADTESGTESTINFGTVNYGNDTEDAITVGNTYLSQTAAKPSYCGTSTYYQTVLPAENASEPASIRIDYKLTATDGSNEVINVKNATATVPAAYTAWKHGYAYTYIFQISQNTNGTTGTPGSDNQGLTAISFDAVVLDDEITGKQETITTVSTRSITTYGYKDGKVTTGQNEYEVGTDIYATAFVPATETEKATTAAPQKIYTVTLDEGAAQNINETTVANALKNGTKDTEENSSSWTVTDANGKKLTVTSATGETVTEVPTEDGRKLSVNAIKWTPNDAAIYAVEYEYTDTEGNTQKAYKIVKVVASAQATPGE